MQKETYLRRALALPEAQQELIFYSALAGHFFVAYDLLSSFLADARSN